MTDSKVTSIGLHPRYKRHNSEALKHLMAALAAQSMAMAALKRFGEASADVFIRDRDTAMERYQAAIADQRSTKPVSPFNHAAGDEFMTGDVS